MSIPRPVKRKYTIQSDRDVIYSIPPHGFEFASERFDVKIEKPCSLFET